MMRLKYLILSIVLTFSFASIAKADSALGTVEPVVLDPFTFLFNGDFDDTVTFSLDDPFSFTTTTTGVGQELTNLEISLQETTLGTDVVTATDLGGGVWQAVMEYDYLPAGDYTFNIDVTTSGSSFQNVVTGANTIAPAVDAVPEPRSYGMLLAGLGVLAWRFRHQA